MPEIIVPLSTVEAAALHRLSAKQNLPQDRVLVQALRLYQDHLNKLEAGETCTWSGDAQRAYDFAGDIVPKPETIMGTKMAGSKDEIIIREARDRADDDQMEVVEIAARGRFEVWPDGRQIFYFDDVPLVEFFPMETTSELVDGMYKVKASQQYKVLT